MASLRVDVVRANDDAIALSNDQSLNQYFDLIESFVATAPRSEIEISSAIIGVGDVSEVKLEDAILIALLGVWADDETRPSFTTTEIASLINKTFKKINPKHKDNVSRYFNQDFYVYYEISNSIDQSIRRYRLSNTGYGKAVQVLREILHFSSRA